MQMSRFWLGQLMAGDGICSGGRGEEGADLWRQPRQILIRQLDT